MLQDFLAAIPVDLEKSLSDYAGRTAVELRPESILHASGAAPLARPSPRALRRGRARGRLVGCGRDGAVEVQPNTLA